MKVQDQVISTQFPNVGKIGALPRGRVGSFKGRQTRIKEMSLSCKGEINEIEEGWFSEVNPLLSTVQEEYPLPSPDTLLQVYSLSCRIFTDRPKTRFCP